MFAFIEDTFDDIFGPLSVPVLLFDVDGKMINGNRSFQNLTKVDKKEIPNRSVLSFLNLFKDDDTWMIKMIPRNHMTKLTDNLGNLIPVTVNYKIFKDENKTYRGGIGFVTDLSEFDDVQKDLRKIKIEYEALKEKSTDELPDNGVQERKRLEQEVQESKEFLENVIESCGDGICIADANGKLIKTNQAFATMLGKDKTDLENGFIYDFWPTQGTFQSTTGETITLDETYRTNFLNRMEKEFLRGDAKIGNLEAFAAHANGKVIPCELSMAAQKNAEGVMTGGVGTARDITERKIAEKALKEAYLLRKRFITNITHDLRTPLTLSIGPMEGILRGEFGTLNKEMEEQLSIGLGNSRQLLKLVNQLLDLSRLESGAMRLNYQKKDINEFVSSILDSFSPISKKKTIALKLVPCSELSLVLVDPGKLGKVLFNILGNAFKFTLEKGQISVCIDKVNIAAHDRVDELQDRDKKEHIRISVADTGIGIKTEALTSIFDRFKQAGDGVVREQGSGIGLAHAKELIELMGGQITVESELGKGSTFFIDIPIDTEPLPNTQERSLDIGDELYLQPDIELSDIAKDTSASDSSLTGKKPLVLIVDDNSDVRRYVAGIIKKKYDYVSAANGLEALRELEKRLPDAILCDVVMPEMDGRKFLNRVRTTPSFSHIPFIFLTARADFEMKIAGLEEGADDYVVKPFNSLELLARINALLRMRDLRNENEKQSKNIDTLNQKLSRKYHYGNIIGNSPAMRRVFQMIETIKDEQSSVLLTGETGTGKELVANAIHYNSLRKKGPMVSVNCGAIPKELMESEFFGHVKGAYTGAIQTRMGYFQAADKGTLFLDEIGEMDKDMQVKLLRVLEVGEIKRVGDSKPIKVDVRLIAATNKDLIEAVQKGHFREDLYYRIHVIPLHLPPLRERTEDIPLLIEHFQKAFQSKHNQTLKSLREKDMRLFLTYTYPGNIRELEHIIERYCLLGGDVKNLFEAPRNPKGNRAQLSSFDTTLSAPNPLKVIQKEAERELIIHTLESCGNNHTKAAKKLNIARSSLYRKLNDYGIV